MKFFTRCCAAFLGAALFLPAAAQTNSASQPDSATFDADGTAHVYRVVPMPSTVSPEAQTWLASLSKKKSQTQNLAERRIATDAWRKKDSAEARQLYPVNVEETNIGGVRTDVITPLDLAGADRGRVWINLHGGGFVSDSGSLIEGIPMANLARIKVVSVYYRLAPENPFPAAVDDVVAVYRELLKTYKPQAIGIFGTSAGAILTCEVTLRLKQLGLPLPAALGIFSVLTDFSRPRIRGKFLLSMDSRASYSPLTLSEPRMILIPARLTGKIQCCLRCSRTLQGCLPACWSPVPAIYC